MIVGAILSGGASRRMGQDKSGQILAGKTLAEHVVQAVRPQVEQLIIVGGDKALLNTLGLKVIEDSIPGRLGPLAGVLTAMEWFGSHNPTAKRLFVTAVDMPFLPPKLVATLADNSKDAATIFPLSQGRRQYMAGLWDMSLVDDLRRDLLAGEVASVRSFVQRHSFAEIEIDPETLGGDPFFNVNSIEDLIVAKRMMRLD